MPTTGAAEWDGTTARASSEQTPPRTLFKSLIPPELLYSWMRGEYVLGTTKDDYRYTGFSLMLRGFYRYRVCEIDKSGKADSRPTFGGIAVAYLPRGDLAFAGVRLFEEPSGTPVFWRSAFSKFIESDDAQGDKENTTEIHFPYRVFRSAAMPGDSGAGPSGSLTRKPSVFKEKETIEEILKSMKDASDDPFDALEENPNHCYYVLSRLAEFLNDHVVSRSSSAIGQSDIRGPCILIPPTRPSENPSEENDFNHDRFDLKISGTYYGVIGHFHFGPLDRAIVGHVEFLRYRKEFLRHISARC